jgi:transposase InsO family protein
LSKKTRMMGAEPGRPNELSPITRIDTARVPVQSAAGRSFIEPGSRWQNPFVGSFGSRVRDEVLSVEAFDSVLEAQTVITDWRTIYNTGGHTAVSAGDRRRPMPLA